jgi:DNA-binding transcriptional LysR family regulator
MRRDSRPRLVLGCGRGAGVHPVAVSQQVAALEREAGTRLVERGVRPVRLTDAGRALLAHAEAVLARLDEAQQELHELAGLRRGRLRLASFPTAIATLVPRAVALFTQRHPDVELTVLDDHRQGLLPRLHVGSWTSRSSTTTRRCPTPGSSSSAPTCWTTRSTWSCPTAIRWRAGRRSPWSSSPPRPGSAAPPTAPTRGSSCTAAGRRGSSRASPSAATTTTRCRPSSPSGWGSPCSPAWR